MRRLRASAALQLLRLSVHPTPLPNARAQWHTSARSSELFDGKESRAFLTMRSFAAAALLVGLVGAMEIGKGGVYDSPMAQDYYVKRFGFLFGGGRSGMHGIEALQADGLVAEGGKVETKAPAEEMRNSVDTYYKAVMPSKVKAHSRKLATQALQKEKVMVELAPKMMGESKPKMFHRFMAVP